MTEDSPPALDLTAITASPEFQDAVRKAAADGIATALAAATAVKATGVVTDDIKELFSELAVQMSNIADQGNHRTKVAPELLRQWEKARARMWDLIEAARSNGKAKPEYKLLAPVYLNERLIQPFVRDDKSGRARNVEITWTGAPNLAMLPLNPVAEEIFAAFKESIGSTAQLGRVTGPHGGVTRIDGRPYVLTPGGLSVKGEAERVPDTLSGAPFDDEVRVGRDHDNNDPNTEFVNILGTVAKPARRSGVGRRPAAKA
jgi:hypothetical protein